MFIFSNNSLFAVPANQEFVYIKTSQSEAADPVNFFLQQLCLGGGNKDLGKVATVALSGKGGYKTFFHAQLK